MNRNGLPPETASFIRAYIDSVGQLEILLLLHASALEAFSPQQINEKLRSNLDFVQHGLQLLGAKGLVKEEEERVGHYRYAPKSEELGNAVDSLAECYANYRVRVIDAIYSPRDPMQSFSDAFRIKREPGNHDG